MITAEKLSIAVQARLTELGETPESMVEDVKSFMVANPAANDEELLADAMLLRPAIEERLPQVDFLTVRRLERALGYSEFTLFAFSADGRGLPEFGETCG